MDNMIEVNLNTSITVGVYEDGEIFFNEPVQVLDKEDIIKIYEAIISFKVA